MPKISIIIPTYNRADLLPRAINSVLNQTFKDFELFIVDDGSTDNTKEVVNLFVKKDNRIKYIYQKNSGGAANPKNNAIKYCSGKYIAYLDHDDEWFPTKLEKQYNLFEQSTNKKLGMVSCNVLIINEKEKINGVHKMSKYHKLEDLLLSGNEYAFSNSSMMIDRSIVDIVGTRDENLKIFEDLDFTIRLALAGYDLDFVDETLVKYYIDANNFSKDFKRASPDYEKFIKKHEQLLKKYPKILAVYYRHLGTMYLLADEKLKARKAFVNSIHLKPSIRNMITVLCALFGKRVYIFLLSLKKKGSLI